MRTAVFIDGANVFYQLKDESVRFDFKSLITDELLDAHDELTSAHYFNSENGRDTLQRFFQVLTLQNIQVHVLSAVEEGGRYQQKGVDVLLAITAVAAKDSYDKIVIVSGDADFIPLGEFLKAQGKTVLFAGFKRAFSHQFKGFKKIFLDDAVEHLERNGKAWTVQRAEQESEYKQFVDPWFACVNKDCDNVVQRDGDFCHVCIRGKK